MAISSPKQRDRRSPPLLARAGRRRLQARNFLRPLGRIFAHLPSAWASQPQPPQSQSQLPSAARSICDAVRGAALAAARRWDKVMMTTAESSSATGGLQHAETLAFFSQQRSALHAISDSAVALALAPVFYCCVALDRMVTQPVTLPTTSVFSASVITFVLKVFAFATELRQTRPETRVNNLNA